MYLKNHLLIAMPTLTDKITSRSVIYICEHGDTGAMGLVINKPIDNVNASILLGKHNINISQERLTELEEMQIFYGGPLEEDHGFILHRSSSDTSYRSSLNVTNDINVTTSKDILDSLADNPAKEEILIILGYIAWGKGQLEQEIKDNHWLTVEADNELLFTTPRYLCWQTAAQKLGIDINTISLQSGRA